MIIDLGPVTDGIIELRMAGLLDRASAVKVRTALLKCLADGPKAIIVDATELWTRSQVLLAVFPAVARQQPPPGADVLIVGAAPELYQPTGGRVLGHLRRYDTMTAARLAAIVAPTPLRRSLTLRPVLSAPAQARDMVAAACADWGIVATEPATLVISELVSNAVEHAGTDLTVVASLRGPHLYLSVRDRCPHQPRLRPADPMLAPAPLTTGRGLHMVDVHSVTWGTMPTACGKLVWAAIPVAAAQPPN